MEDIEIRSYIPAAQGSDKAYDCVNCWFRKYWALQTEQDYSEQQCFLYRASTGAPCGLAFEYVQKEIDRINSGGNN